MRAVFHWALGFVGFWWDVCKRTFWLLLGSYKRADLIGGLLTWFGLGVAAWLQHIPAHSWVIGGGVFLLYAILAAIYEKFREIESDKETLEKQAAIEERRAAVKDLLGAADDSADELPEDPSVADVEGWGTRTHGLIEAAYGRGEAKLFLSGAGLKFFSVGTNQQNRLYAWRIRLSELIGRADSLSVRPDFDPDEWADRG